MNLFISIRFKNYIIKSEKLRDYLICKVSGVNWKLWEESD